ncbi:uncharacterized protein SPAPADRAFT_62465 [Spathaspora passalidarum NRRL Y-27907]|uniref:Uncharacterized protein n=1 Tax=Spathaspora passalidarum (strain NRRL Y-27907 / 11-Y1) TaxID=619300 RepID=G3AS07_SPAPN|nr:uncharacterized protein SPAPADRAFT_62465 [Spathaspora passalidarum NRRL Y-27907]EGW31856.1 hypothetical protein SPAPADRAFT_62465 [Spathaspora passalidarum NRRL Y-27907]
MSSDDNKEFGQLGDIAKKFTEGKSNEEIGAEAQEAIGKFEKLSDQDKEGLLKGALGKVEGDKGESKEN